MVSGSGSAEAVAGNARWLVVVYYGLGEVERIANDYLKR